MQNVQFCEQIQPNDNNFNNANQDGDNNNNNDNNGGDNSEANSNDDNDNDNMINNDDGNDNNNNNNNDGDDNNNNNEHNDGDDSNNNNNDGDDNNNNNNNNNEHNDGDDNNNDDEYNEMVFEVNMPDKNMIVCPVNGCPFNTNNKTRLRKHFRARHPEHIIIIVQEGLLPQCEECGIFQRNVNTMHHLQSEDCKKYAEIRRNRRFDTCQMAAKNVRFKVKGENIKMVQSFKYLGRVLQYNDDDLTAVESQLVKARGVWGRIGKIIKKKSLSNPRIMGIFYKVIVQTVLLYGAESWVLGTHARNKINSFHHRCSRFITGRHISLEGETWIYPSRVSTLAEADLLGVEDYIVSRKNTVREYAESTGIFNRCKMTEGHICRKNRLTWWKQDLQKSNEAEISSMESDLPSTSST